MHRRQLVITDLQPARLPDPRERPLDDPTDLSQSAPVGRSGPCQVVLDSSPLEPLAVAWRPVLPVAVQGVRPTASTVARLADQWDVVEQRHRQERLIPLGPRDSHRQGGAVSVYQQVAFRAFFGPIRGVFAGEDPPKTAR
jgi:hypothetical protein